MYDEGDASDPPLRVSGWLSNGGGGAPEIMVNVDIILYVDCYDS